MYFKVKTSEEVFELLKGFMPTSEESITLENALGRVLSREILSPEDLPGFERSTMDGYAIRAKDVFGATESIPVLLEVVGEVSMGKPPEISVRGGQDIHRRNVTAGRRWRGNAGILSFVR